MKSSEQASVSTEGEKAEPGPFCADGGTCHHQCETKKCFRQEGCAPLSGSGLTDEWKKVSASPVTGAHPEPTDFAAWCSLPDVGAQCINNTRLRNIALSAWEKATEIAHREMAEAVCNHLSVTKDGCDCKFHRAIGDVTGAPDNEQKC